MVLNSHGALCPSFYRNTHIEEEINRLRAELLRKDQDNERMQMQLAAEKEERERAQRKVDNMTRMMLGGGGAGGGSAGKQRRENRRETWCPGAAGARKRPLLPNMAELLEEESSAGGAEASRRSDGGALPVGRKSEGAVTQSPPHKLQKQNGEAWGAAGVWLPATAAKKRAPSYTRLSACHEMLCRR